jgi:hypothetical protein
MIAQGIEAGIAEAQEAEEPEEVKAIEVFGVAIRN